VRVVDEDIYAAERGRHACNSCGDFVRLRNIAYEPCYHAAAARNFRDSFIYACRCARNKGHCRAFASAQDSDFAPDAASRARNDIDLSRQACQRRFSLYSMFSFYCLTAGHSQQAKVPLILRSNALSDG